MQRLHGVLRCTQRDVCHKAQLWHFGTPKSVK